MTEEAESPFGRGQREMHELTMRQLADLVGIVNPYLSQIDSCSREPLLERVLEAIAENLEMSAETLKRHKPAPPGGGASRRGAGGGRGDLRRQGRSPASQRKALVEVYEAFVASRLADPVLEARAATPGGGRRGSGRARRGRASHGARGTGATARGGSADADPVELAGDEVARSVRVRLRDLASEVGLRRRDLVGNHSSAGRAGGLRLAVRELGRRPSRRSRGRRRRPSCRSRRPSR